MRPVRFTAVAALLVFATNGQAQSGVDFPALTLKTGVTPLTFVPIWSTPNEPTNGSAPIAPNVRAPLSADAATLVASNTRFGLDIFQELSSRAKPNENVLISPFSISAALAMTYAGARGQTAQQMADVLRFTLPGAQVHPAFGELLRDLTAHRDGYQLNIANRIFAQSNYPFENTFQSITQTHYGAPMEGVNFRMNTEAARRRINEWVEEQTNDKIRDLLLPGMVKQNTRMVLTNAIYFDGSWKNKFDKDFTYDDTYFGVGAPSQVPMMHQLHSFRYAERPGYQMVEMPYAGDDLSMVVMLPNAQDGLSKLETSLTPDELSAALDSMRQTSVALSLPKFTFDSSFKLADTLKAMGMTQAFDQLGADLKGIADPEDEQLFIDEAVHKAFINVDEEGTEAAAATAVIIGATSTCYCLPPPPKTFDADHPFLFALRDNHTGSLLFIGRVVDPGSLTPAALLAVPEPASITLAVVAMFAIAWYRGRGI